MLKNTAKRIAAATLVGGALAVSPMVLPTAQAAPVANCAVYTSNVTTTTTVTLATGSLVPRTGFTVRATVTIDGAPSGAPALGGTVTFRYRDQTQIVDVVNGVATSTEFIARRGGGQVIASYSGLCVAGVSATSPGFNIGTSTGRLPIVAGVSATAGGGPVVAGVSASRGPSVAGLAATGLDSQTELFGVLGLGLVTVGGLTLVMRRRRIQA